MLLRWKEGGKELFRGGNGRLEKRERKGGGVSFRAAEFSLFDASDYRRDFFLPSRDLSITNWREGGINSQTYVACRNVRRETREFSFT